jgi:hypothetical protein
MPPVSSGEQSSPAARHPPTPLRASFHSVLAGSGDVHGASRRELGRLRLPVTETASPFRSPPGCRLIRRASMLGWTVCSLRPAPRVGPPSACSRFPRVRSVADRIEALHARGSLRSPLALVASLRSATSVVPRNARDRPFRACGRSPHRERPFRAEVNMVSTPAGKRRGLRGVAAHPTTPTPLAARSGRPLPARGWFCGPSAARAARARGRSRRRETARAESVGRHGAGESHG